ncbi:aspartate/glutamate racemase family protein [Roseibium aestuarii]|uniref:Aspartate/glutamate racemase family protein n=1 Tax=Roseibium aestuarii TaxID=2600299 RepID=A0ABW4K0K1_9HYPH|nr:aspartate/glutamate racemase family protein [Roseibium aestuarii]
MRGGAPGGASAPERRIVLINPNTSAATTQAMVGIAREVQAGEGSFELVGLTAPSGPPIISTPAELAAAGDVVAGLVAELEGNCAGAIVSAFGDPGLQRLRERLSVPVVGIAEAGMRAAAAGGRRFAIVTTTPDLVAPITARAQAYGVGRQLCGTFLTEGSLAEVMAAPERLREALAKTIRRALGATDAGAIVIGGGPLARAARELGSTCTVPLIEPVPEACRALLRQIMPLR